MSLSIQQCKTILERKFRGASLDDVQGISDFTVFEEAANNLLSKIDPYETVRTSEINLFNEVYDYSSPSDLKGKKVIDLRPQADRNSTDDFRQSFTEDFDRDKKFKDNEITVQFDEASKFLRINKSVSNSISVTDLEDDNYTATSGITNIIEDTILQFGDGKSIRFDVASGSNLLTWNGDSTIDLTDHEQKSNLFLNVYWPDSSVITSITLRIGSDSANYYEITGAIQFGSVRNGVNLYKFTWDGATETGTVDIDDCDYARLAIVTTSADTDIRIGRLSSKLPTPYELVYYSNALFRNSAGTTWLSKPTTENDLLNLETEAQNIFLGECEVIIAEDLQRDEEARKFRTRLGIDDFGKFTGGGLYADYKSDKPSEAIRPNLRWYSLPRRNGRGSFWKRTNGQ